MEGLLVPPYSARKANTSVNEQGIDFVSKLGGIISPPFCQVTGTLLAPAKRLMKNTIKTLKAADEI